jgi:hypothetical protein
MTNNSCFCRPLTGLLWAALVLCGARQHLAAQAPADTARRLEAVVVTGERRQAVASSVQRLSGAELQRLSSLSVADAIRYFSGVQIKDYGGIGGLKTVNVRSLGSQHTGVFYDGIQVGNAQNGVVDLGRFSLDNMELISLYNGQKNALLQPAKDFATASAIYMTARRPLFVEARNDNFSVKFKTGSFDLLNPSLLWEHRWNNRLCLSAGAEYMHTSGEYRFRYKKHNGYDTTEVRQNGDVTLLRAEATLFGRLTEGDWKVKAYFYNSERGYPGASVKENPGAFKHQDRQWDDNFFLQSSLRKHFGAFYSLLLNAKYAYDYLHYLSDPRLDVSTMYVENHYHQQEAYFSSAHEFTFFDFWSANLACDFQYNTLDADLFNFVYPERYTLLTALASSLQLSPLRLQASVLHTYVQDKTQHTGSAADARSEFTPSLAFSLTPWGEAGLAFRGFYKRIFRLPTFNDLYYTFIGNKDLKPEYTNQYSLGAAWAHDFAHTALQRIDLQADLYYNQVADKIIAMPTDNQFRWTMINLGYVEIRGLDLAAHGRWRLGAVEAGLRLSYTCQKAQDFTNPSGDWYGGQIPYVPWHSGSAIANASWKNWRLTYSFIYTGERYTAIANIPQNYQQPWYTHDLAVSWQRPWKRIAASLTAEVNNIFNQAYEVVQCYPMPGTNFRLTLSLTL